MHSFSAWLWINFKIGLFSFGSVSRTMLYEDAVVREKGWLTEDEFQEALTLAQVFPGPNLVNLAACIGFKLFPARQAILAVFPLTVPGAILVVLTAIWVPLDQPWIAELFRGFAIGAFLLMGRFLWALWKGLAPKASPQPSPRATLVPGIDARKIKGAGRYFLVLVFTSLLIARVPTLHVVFAGLGASLAWEFLPWGKTG